MTLPASSSRGEVSGLSLRLTSVTVDMPVNACTAYTAPAAAARLAANRPSVAITAHLIGGHGECSWLPRDEAETEAESVAYVVGAHFGLDTGERSFPYVALWSRDRQTFQSVLGKIQTTSARIIDGIEGPLEHLEAGLE